ncbi:hypothetical protein Y032_0018g3663 [Ancylostoma ceylanicum]|nr:hypothetical protein Y032_0018g3663 [Ancylostoma ceylanicum]
MRNNSFYIIMAQIIGCNTSALLIDLYMVFPLTLTGKQYMGDSMLLYHIPLFIESVAFQGLLYFSFLLAINRFAIFLLPKINSKLFSPRGTVMISILVWIYVITILILHGVFGCEKKFSKEGFYFWYDCKNRNKGHFHYADFMDYQGYVIPLLMSLMYAIICLQIKISRWNSTIDNANNVEIRFLSQTIPLSTLLSIQVFAFIFIPQIRVTGYARFFVSPITTFTTLANDMAPPIVLLLYNKDIQKYARRALCCKSNKQASLNSTSRNYSSKIFMQIAKKTTTNEHV